MSHVRLLVNPAAGRGRAMRRLEAARHALERVGPLDVVLTKQVGDEARLAQEAVRDRVRVLAVLGGDGTASRVAAELVACQRGTNRATATAQDCTTVLAVLSAGTGNDFAKSLGSPSHDYSEMAVLIARGSTRAIDVGSIDGRTFVNAAGMGFDVAVLERTTRARWLRGDALYAVCALQELFRYQGMPLRITLHDSVHQLDDSVATRLMVVIANGQWFGGTFRIAPKAQLDDGVLDCVVIADASPWRRMRLFAAAPRGGHVSAAEVAYVNATGGTVAAAAIPSGSAGRMEVDGELYELSGAQVEFAVVPRALLVVR